MARVDVITIDGKKGRKITGFFAALPHATVEATANQLRVLAQESRELIVDKTYAGRARPPGRRRSPRPPNKAQRQDIPGSERKRYPHVALADRTVEKKARREQDGRPLIARGIYIPGIEVFKGERNGMPYYIVRPKPSMHPDAKVSHRVLAAILEYGTSTVPPRPHWAPVLRIVLQELKRRGPDVRAEALRLAVKART